MKEKDNSSITEHEQVQKIYFGENNKKISKNLTLPDNSVFTINFNSFFIPLIVVHQFIKPINLFFLFITVLTTIPITENNDCLLAISFFCCLSVSIIREVCQALETLKRDKFKNAEKVHKFIQSKWCMVDNSSIRPGDIVKINRDEESKFTFLLVKSSNEEGSCNIDQYKLEGNRVFQERIAIHQFQRLKEENYTNSLVGKMKLNDEKDGQYKIKIIFHGDKILADKRNVIERGSILRNTEFAIGIVLLTGHNTLIQRKQKPKRQKSSESLKFLHKNLPFVLLFYLFICMGISFYQLAWDISNQNYIQIYSNKSGVFSFFKCFLISLIRFAHFVPINIYAGYEIICLIKILVIERDIEIKNSNIKVVRSELTEDLGQVKLVCMNKPGMDRYQVLLRSCYIDGSVYGNTSGKSSSTKYTLNGDSKIVAKLVGEDTENVEREKIMEFLVHLSVCNEVKLERRDDSNEFYFNGDIEEVAMVKAARQIGVEVIPGQQKEITICNTLFNQQEKFEIVKILPYDSCRNRFSIIIKDQNNSGFLMMTKGSEEAMLDKVILSETGMNAVKTVNKKFDKEGFKVVVLGQKFLKQEVLEEFLENLKEENKNSLRKLYDEIENELEFVGSVFLEMKLDEGVVQTIGDFLNLDIFTWILSGDNTVNLEKYAKICKLIDNNSKPLYLTTNRNELQNNLSSFLSAHDIKKDENGHVTTRAGIEVSQPIQDFYIVFDGISFEMVQNDHVLMQTIVTLASMSKTVLCSHFTPSQKAAFVRIVKNITNWVIVSYGNDIQDSRMLSEGDIGVAVQGIAELESNADFVVNKFCSLEKLMLKYGRDSYISVSNLITFSFFKSFMLVFCEVIFSFYCGGSIQNYFSNPLLYLYTGLVNAFPLVVLLSFDKTLEFNKIRKFPILYKLGQDRFLLNNKRFFLFILNGVLNAVCVFYFSSYIISNNSSFGHWRTSTISFSIIIQITSYKLLIITEISNVYCLLVVAIAIAFYYIVLFILSSSLLSGIFGEELFQMSLNLIYNPRFYFINCSIFFLTILPDLTYHQVKELYWKNPEKEISLRILHDPDFKSTFIDNQVTSSKDIIKVQKMYTETLRLKKKEKDPTYENTTTVALNQVKTYKPENLTMENDNSALVLKENTISNNTNNQMTVENHKDTILTSAHLKQDSSSREMTRNYISLLPRSSSKSKCNSESRTKDKNTSSTILRLNDTISNYENIVFIGKHSSRNTITKPFEKNPFDVTNKNHTDLAALKLFTVKEKVKDENTINNSSYNNYSSSNHKNSPMGKSGLKESEISSDLQKDPSDSNSNAKKQSITSDFQNFGTFFKRKTMKDDNSCPDGQNDSRAEFGKLNYLTTFKQDNFEKIIINNEEEKNEKIEDTLEKKIHEQEDDIKQEESKENFIKFNTNRVDNTITESIKGDLKDIINAKTKEFMNGSKYVSSSDDESGNEFAKPQQINKIIQIQTKKKVPTFYHNLSSNTDNSVSATTSKYYPTDNEHSNSLFSKNINDSISLESKPLQK